MKLLLPVQIIGIELEERVQLTHHPCEGDVRDAGVRVGAPDVGVYAWEPALFENFGKDLAGGLLPDGGGEGLAVFVESEGLEGVFDIGGDGGVDEGVFGDGFGPETSIGDTEGTWKWVLVGEDFFDHLVDADRLYPTHKLL